mmetsp:Transcript_23042/g.54447  ORF Transcript_23042/g.54447 Transcript_23042/m.54447 type:complete len:453 (-) Transcript_23042:1464-2822(-)|eukprot:CAMPEP_0197182430 /NCGR_PEP_ID=MMETSP1423-20130617/6388_1 /TAXON_ID=476441 /ORGANISM="Pseudo-nitzschia heimii, Strain UNC1101" /LENGTH=452 /DNA_ID=CAMNT_0042632849 /DNA_START=111 /DNA_END=1469 /DNA_ORIENTATION=+
MTTGAPQSREQKPAPPAALVAVPSSSLSGAVVEGAQPTVTKPAAVTAAATTTTDPTIKTEISQKKNGSSGRKRSASTSTSALHDASSAKAKSAASKDVPPSTSSSNNVNTEALANNSNNSGGGGTGSIGRVGKDGEPLSEKKLRRLERNRLSARECRRRKREATENMQGLINQLEGENLRLRLQLQVGEEAEQTIHQKQIDSTKALDELLKSGKASESEIYAKIEEYKEKFADYGRDRLSAMEFHLRNVERLLMPTQTTRVIMSTLKQSDGSSGSGNNTNGSTINLGNGTALAPVSSPPLPPPSTITPGKAMAPNGPPPPTTTAAESKSPPRTTKELFLLLNKNLDVTPTQALLLKDSRMITQEMDEILQETLTALKELRGRLAQCGQDLETEFNCIRQILTPSQSAKFLVWVAQNKACMHMLNELWSKNYPSSPSSPHDGRGMISATASED